MIILIQENTYLDMRRIKIKKKKISLKDMRLVLNSKVEKKKATQRKKKGYIKDDQHLYKFEFY